MKKQVLATLAIVLLWGVATSQVGINTTDPADGSILDIDSDNKGILIPRVNISNLNNIAPITGGSPEGLLVYNTDPTTGPGYFYWSGSSWVAVGSERGWGLTGNAGTNAANNFVGTTDTQALTFKTNSTARLTIPNANQIHANSSGTAALPFYSFATDTNTGMYSSGGDNLNFATNGGQRFQIANSYIRSYQNHRFANGTVGAPSITFGSDTNLGIYRIDTDILGFSTDGTERMRIVADGRVSVNGSPLYVGDRFTSIGSTYEYAINGYTTSGTGVYGQNSSGVGNGVFGNSTNVGVRGYGAHGAILESGLAGGYGLIAWNTTSSGPSIALQTIGQNQSVLSTTSQTSVLSRGVEMGNLSFAQSTTGTGVVGVGNSSLTSVTLVSGSGISGSGATIGVYGFGYNDSNDVWGGYFDNERDEYAYVGGNQAGTSYKIIGMGAVSTIVDDTDGNPVVMFAPEAPEVLFQDYGIAKLENGRAFVKLDPIFSKNINVNDEHPLKVFVQLEGDCNGVYVTNKSATGFDVIELQNGNSNVQFSWSVVATRANTERITSKGKVVTSKFDVRYPDAPKKLDAIQTETKEVKKSEVLGLTTKIEDNGKKRDNDTILLNNNTSEVEGDAINFSTLQENDDPNIENTYRD